MSIPTAALAREEEELTLTGCLLGDNLAHFVNRGTEAQSGQGLQALKSEPGLEPRSRLPLAQSHPLSTKPNNGLLASPSHSRPANPDLPVHIPFLMKLTTVLGPFCVIPPSASAHWSWVVPRLHQSGSLSLCF